MDFAGLASLSGIEPWNEIRQARARDEQRAAILNAMAQQENQKQKQNAEEVQQYLNTVGQIKVLANDKQAIQDKEKELRLSIAEGIKKSHGNLEEYLNTGGKTALSAYRNNLLDSQEVNRGLLNAFNHNRALAAQQQGLTLRPINIGGKEVDYNTQFDLYNQGKIKDLQFNGAYEEPAVPDAAKYFSEQLSTPTEQDPTQGLTHPRIATPQEHFEFLLSQKPGKGMSMADHIRWAKEHARGGFAYGFNPQTIDYYNHSRIQEAQAGERLRLQREKLSQNQFSANPYEDIHSGQLGEEKNQPVNVSAYLNQFGQQPGQDVAPDAEKNIPTLTTPLTTHALKDAEANSMLGLTYHKPTQKENWSGWTGNIINGDKAISAHNLMPYPGDLNQPGVVVKDVVGIKTIPSPDLKGKRAYAILDVKFPNKAKMGTGLFGSGFGATNHHWWKPDTETAASQGDVNWDENTIRVLVPVQTPDENQLSVRQLNATLKKNDNAKMALTDDSFLNDATLAE